MKGDPDIEDKPHYEDETNTDTNESYTQNNESDFASEETQVQVPIQGNDRRY